MSTCLHVSDTGCVVLLAVSHEFAPCDFALRRLMFDIDVCFLAFDVVSFFAYTVVPVVRRSERCLVVRYVIRDAVLVDGPRMLFNANNAI